MYVTRPMIPLALALFLSAGAGFGCAKIAPKITSDPRTNMTWPKEIEPQSFDIKDERTLRDAVLFFLRDPKSNPDNPFKSFVREKNELLVAGIIAPPCLIRKPGGKDYKTVNLFYLFDKSYPVQYYLDHPQEPVYAVVVDNYDEAIKVAYALHRNPAKRNGQDVIIAAEDSGIPNTKEAKDKLLSLPMKNPAQTVREFIEISGYINAEELLKFLQSREAKRLRHLDSANNKRPQEKAPQVGLKKVVR